MGRLIYSAIASLDGYVADEDGNFDWAMPDEEVHAFINDLERPVGTYLYGRRMYETMVFGETAGPAATTPRSSGTSGGPAIPRGGAWCRYALDTPDLATLNEPALYRRGR